MYQWWLAQIAGGGLAVMFLAWRAVARRFGFEASLPVVRTSRVTVWGARLARPLAALASLAAVYLLAAVFFAVSASLTGRFEPSRTIDVNPDGAAAAAGIQDGDDLVSVHGEPVDSAAAVANVLRRDDGRVVEVRIRRDGEERSFSVEPRLVDGSRRIGVRSRTVRRSTGFVEAVGDGVTRPWVAIKAVVDAFGPKPKAELGGVVAMVDATRDAPPESLETTVGAIAGFAGGIVTYLLFSLYPVLLLVLSVLGWRMQQRETPGPTERPM